MNEKETNLPSGENTDLQTECANLRQQVWTLMILLIVLSGTMAVYLYRQSKVNQKDVETSQPQVMQMVQVFNQSQPIMENLVKQLNAYGNTHPDFVPILQKYGYLMSSTPAAPPKK